MHPYIKCLEIVSYGYCLFVMTACITVKMSLKNGETEAGGNRYGLF